MMGPTGAAAAGGMSGLGSGTQTAADLTPNYKIDRDRYLFVTEQSRHLPLAVTLNVDQSHLHEVLAAFANSRLRFQTTQVEFRRVPAAARSSSGSTQPGGFGPAPGVGDAPPPMPTTPSPGGSGAPSPLGGSSGGRRPNGVGPNDFGPNTPATGQAPAAMDNPNLVEVTIYGIASLYERPPDAK